MGLISRIDDGPLQRCLEPHLFFKEIGPLRYLERDILMRQAGSL